MSWRFPDIVNSLNLEMKIDDSMHSPNYDHTLVKEENEIFADIAVCPRIIENLESESEGDENSEEESDSDSVAYFGDVSDYLSTSDENEDEIYEEGQEYENYDLGQGVEIEIGNIIGNILILHFDEASQEFFIIVVDVGQVQGHEPELDADQDLEPDQQMNINGQLMIEGNKPLIEDDIVSDSEIKEEQIDIEYPEFDLENNSDVNENELMVENTDNDGTADSMANEWTEESILGLDYEGGDFQVNMEMPWPSAQNSGHQPLLPISYDQSQIAQDQDIKTVPSCPPDVQLNSEPTLIVLSMNPIAETNVSEQAEESNSQLIAQASASISSAGPSHISGRHRRKPLQKHELIPRKSKRFPYNLRSGRICKA